VPALRPRLEPQSEPVACRFCGNIEADLRSETGDGTDDSVLERLLAGDEMAFSELVRAHHASLLRLALTFVSDRGAAEEVVQDTWLGVLKGLKSFEGRASLKTWIFRILVNRARTRGVRDGRMVNFSALEDSEDEGAALMDRFSAEGGWVQPPAMWQEQNPEALLLRGETMDCLQDAIASLPPNQRAVVTLRDVNGIDAQEVCNILGISETNQRVLLHRARTRVRATLESHLKRG
jgi:RNA polymerase sigma-70 factor (ECF subfamily)